MTQLTLARQERAIELSEALHTAEAGTLSGTTDTSHAADSLCGGDYGAKPGGSKDSTTFDIV